MKMTEFDQPEVAQFTREFEELFYAGDPAAMTAFYTEDAQLMGDAMRPIRGHAAITEFWRQAMTRTAAAGARRAIELHESHTSGDLGYALCTVTVEIPASATSTDAASTAATSTAAISRAVWDATIWRRDDDGLWRITVDISTPLPG
jgi:ketosteroid isomerase-like protein